MTLVTNTADVKKISDLLNPKFGDFSPIEFEKTLSELAENDINAKMLFGHTPLSLALSFNNVDAIKYLFERNPSPNINELTVMEQTALSSMASQNNTEMVRFLLERGATVDPRTFSAVIKKDHLDMAQTLLDHSPDVIKQIDLDYLLISKISEKDKIEAIEFLLGLGASPSAKVKEQDDPIEMTALGVAILGHNTKAMSALINAGANKEETKLSFARQNNQTTQFIHILSDIKDKVSHDITPDKEAYHNIFQEYAEYLPKDLEETIEAIIENAIYDVNRGKKQVCMNELSERLEDLKQGKTTLDRALVDIHEEHYVRVEELVDEAPEVDDTVNEVSAAAEKISKVTFEQYTDFCDDFIARFGSKLPGMHKLTLSEFNAEGLRHDLESKFFSDGLLVAEVSTAFAPIVTSLSWDKISFNIHQLDPSHPLLTPKGREEAYNKLPGPMGEAILTRGGRLDKCLDSVCSATGVPIDTICSMIQKKTDGYQSDFKNASTLAAKNEVLTSISKLYEDVRDRDYLKKLVNADKADKLEVGNGAGSAETSVAMLKDPNSTANFKARHQAGVNENSDVSSLEPSSNNQEDDSDIQRGPP